MREREKKEMFVEFEIMIWFFLFFDLKKMKFKWDSGELEHTFGHSKLKTSFLIL